MTLLTGLLIATDRRSSEACFRCSTSEVAKDISVMIGASAPLTMEECPSGLLFHCPREDLPENRTASSLLSAGKSPVYGPAVLMGFNGEKSKTGAPKPTSISTDAAIRVKQLCHEPVRAFHPKRPLSAYQYFQSFYSKQIKELSETNPEIKKPSRLTEWGPQTMAAWKALTPEQREPFNEQARESSAKYAAARNEFASKFCDPPLRARHAYNCFMATHGSGSSESSGGVCRRELIDKWHKLSEAEKEPYLKEAKLDGERYQRETAQFKKWCEESGNSYDELMRKKKKIRVVPKEKSEPSPAKRSRKPTKKKEVKRVRKTGGETKRAAPGKKLPSAKRAQGSKKPPRKRAKAARPTAPQVPDGPDIEPEQESDNENENESETYTNDV